MIPSILFPLEKGKAVTPENLTATANAIPADPSNRDNLASTQARLLVGGQPEKKDSNVGKWVALGVGVLVLAWVFTRGESV